MSWSSFLAGLAVIPIVVAVLAAAREVFDFVSSCRLQVLGWRGKGECPRFKCGRWWVAIGLPWRRTHALVFAGPWWLRR